MFAKVAILCATLVAVNAQILYSGAALANTGTSTTSRHQDAFGNYGFRYGVIDGYAASKSQVEVGDAYGNKESSYNSYIKHVAPVPAVHHRAPVAVVRHAAPIAHHAAPLSVAHHAAPFNVAHAARLPVSHAAPLAIRRPLAVAHSAPVSYSTTSAINHVNPVALNTVAAGPLLTGSGIVGPRQFAYANGYADPRQLAYANGYGGQGQLGGINYAGYGSFY